MSNGDKKDLTRIEDLSEFIHSEEEELPPEEIFPSSDEEHEKTEEAPDFPDLSVNESIEESNFDGDFTLSTETEQESFPADETPLTPEEGLTLEENSFEETPPELSSTEEEITPIENFTSEETIPVLEEAPSLPEIKSESFFSSPPEQEYKAPENFDEIKKFSENTSFTGMGAEGNPSFSVLVKNVRYVEDVNDIMILMKDLSLITDTEDQMRARLMRGSLLIPRISEYAAIYLAHKLRRFDIDIQVGLSDDIHPPKHDEAPEVGMVSKFNLYQNQTHHFHFNDPKLDISQILVSATPALEGYQVVRYLGVASEHKMIDGEIVEDENSTDIPVYYQELAQKLRAHALKVNSNAIIGINYQLTPLPSEMGQGHKYRLSCTGNLVWVNKI